jgi:phosphoenolpyruvate-protein kinase (PTS system EI component)
LDAGGDKPIPYLKLGLEANPFLGVRAIRLCLQEPELFKVQLRALLRAGLGHNLRIMFPMIATLDEVKQAKNLLAEARAELENAGAPYCQDYQTGIMFEIPSVAWMADEFASQVDFFSVGTNDLTQYTFAAERNNERVAYLGDACHPAILRQIRHIIAAGHRAGCWIGVCGELAGDPDAVPILLGLGLDEFSMSPASVPHAKAILRSWTYRDAVSLAEAALKLESAAAVRQSVNQAVARR